MKKYIAALKSDGSSRIISVGAENETEAREKITEQLDRPGRYEVLNQWKHFGSIVIESK